MTCIYQFLFVLESSEADDSSLHCARVDWANTVWEGLQRWREGGEQGKGGRKCQISNKV